MDSGGTKAIEVVVAGGLGVLGALWVLGVTVERAAAALLRQPVQAARRGLRRTR